MRSERSIPPEVRVRASMAPRPRRRGPRPAPTHSPAPKASSRSLSAQGISPSPSSRWQIRKSTNWRRIRRKSCLTLSTCERSLRMKSVAKARTKHPAFNNVAVAAIFDSFPPKIRSGLLALRALIFDTAAATEGVGALEETLRWGDPSYLTTQSQSGSMIRMNFRGGNCAMYFHCQTNLVARFREIYPDRLNYEGNRAILVGDSG